jgi:hypothetical protein
MFTLFVLVWKYSSHYIFNSIFLLVLDPSLKLAYAADKWEQSCFKEGVAQLEKVVSIS